VILVKKYHIKCLTPIPRGRRPVVHRHLFGWLGLRTLLHHHFGHYPRKTWPPCMAGRN